MCGSRRSAAWHRLAASPSAGLALQALDQPIDTFLEYGLWLTARQLAPFWLPEVQAGRFDFGGQPRTLDLRPARRRFAGDRQAAAGIGRQGRGPQRPGRERSDA